MDKYKNFAKFHQPNPEHDPVYFDNITIITFFRFYQFKNIFFLVLQ